MAEPAGAPTVVLVHGAWHGAWCWDGVVAGLDAHGVQSVAVDLPLTSLADDVAATTAAIDATGGAVVLVGHSYGGVVISEAGNHAATRHLVYIAALAVDSGRNATDAVDDPQQATSLGDAIHFGEDGMVTVDPGSVVECFFADCDPAQAAAAAARLRPTAFACFTDTVSHAAWHDVASTYVVCSQDAAIHPDLQRSLAKQSTDTVEWPTSHSPFLSRPELVSDLLVDITYGPSHE